MKESLLSDTRHEIITLTGILPVVRQLNSTDKLRLIRILAEELENTESIFPLEKGRTYCLPTPYDTFGAAELLMNTLKSLDTDK